MQYPSNNHPSPTGVRLRGPVGRCRFLTRWVPELFGIMSVPPVPVGLVAAVSLGTAADVEVILAVSSTPSVGGFLGPERVPMRVIGIGVGRVLVTWKNVDADRMMPETICPPIQSTEIDVDEGLGADIVLPETEGLSVMADTAGLGAGLQVVVDCG